MKNTIILCVLAGLILGAGCKEKGESSTAQDSKYFPEMPEELRKQVEEIAKEQKELGLNPQFDGEPLLRELEEKNYEAVYEYIDSKLQEQWEISKFKQQVAEVREEIGEDWQVREAGFMNNITPQGPACSLTYQLTGGFQSSYILEAAGLDRGKGYKIVQWSLSSPCANQDEELEQAREAAKRFMEYLQQELYDEAIEMMLPELKKQFPSDFLAEFRQRFWSGGQTTYEFHKEALRKLINGRHYFCLTVYPAGLPMNQLEMLLGDKEGEMKLASMNFRMKMGR